MNKPLISVVVPFYNEGGGVDVFDANLSVVLDELPEYDFQIVAIDDGSSDDTLRRLKHLAASDPRYHVIEFSRNFGKEAAMTAGLDDALGEAAIILDADLQDPPELIKKMLAAWREGADMVLARRTDRSSDGSLKRRTAQAFYNLHNRLADVQIPANVGDFRLLNRQVIDALGRLPERQRFMKGLFAWVGYRTVTIDYARPARKVGNSKFSAWRLWNFALDGISGFSTVPLRIWSYIGVVGALITLIYAAWITLRTLVYGIDLPGYASLLVIILFFGSLQLISVGVLGEYLGRIHDEVKQRPVYLVRKRHGAHADSSEPDRAGTGEAGP